MFSDCTKVLTKLTFIYVCMFNQTYNKDKLFKNINV